MSPLGPVVNLGFAAFTGNDTLPAKQPHSMPPAGNLHFRALKLLDETIRNPAHGAPCIQQPAQVGIGSEDCLKLNIWKPSSALEMSGLPIIIYFHIHSTTCNLNLNMGLHDQHAVTLKWVQRNIHWLIHFVCIFHSSLTNNDHRFRGDLDKVMIAGESAGATSVVMQMVAFSRSKLPVFKHTIIQSIGFGPTLTLGQVEDTFKDVSAVVGCLGRSVMQCLRNTSIGAIISAINHASVPPVIEGSGGFLPDLPSHLIVSGRTFVGSTSMQFDLDDDIRRLLFAHYSGVAAVTMQQAFELYLASDTPGSLFKSQYERAPQMSQDIVLGCMDLQLAQTLMSHSVDDVFTFRWNLPHTVLFEETPFKGVMHTFNLYFLFDSNKARQSQEVIGFWTSLISSGNPSTENMPAHVH
ncbi:alpha/beta-hydrolase [Pleurotus eryngii]|uniref:Carboxylic ester hydrolase n=1 Tax=Pleurotus eryngii TaxID=5323 RepID=A0A9P6DDH7_PLEER|nr:alpha/beta-hydrolase [Pleurotus eryngii]